MMGGQPPGGDMMGGNPMGGGPPPGGDMMGGAPMGGAPAGDGDMQVNPLPRKHHGWNGAFVFWKLGPKMHNL